MYSRLLRRYSMVEDFLCSSRNIITVKEKMLQLNDMFRLLMSLLRNSLNAQVILLSAMLSEEEQMENDDWFHLFDEEVFVFKRKVNLWLKNVEQKQRSCISSERSHSKVSSKKCVKSNMTKTSSSSSKSSGSRAKTLEEKAKLAEIEAEEKPFLFRRQIAKNEVEKLKFSKWLQKLEQEQRYFLIFISIIQVLNCITVDCNIVCIYYNSLVIE